MSKSVWHSIKLHEKYETFLMFFLVIDKFDVIVIG
jgi:hypothetical protein